MESEGGYDPGGDVPWSFLLYKGGPHSFEMAELLSEADARTAVNAAWAFRQTWVGRGCEHGLG